MHAHKIRTTVGADGHMHVKLPSDFPPGEVEVIVLHPAHVAKRPRISVDDLIAARLPRPATVGPVSLEDMEQAIQKGAQTRGDL